MGYSHGAASQGMAGVPGDNQKRFLRGSILGLAFAVFLSGCATAGGEVSAESRAEDIAVQAATIRWLIENNDSALGSSATAYCVGVGTGIVAGEPSVALIRALREEIPRVQPISACRWARDAAVGRRVVDELSESPALALFVDPPEYDGEDAARVWAEYVERPGMGRAYDCRLENAETGWQVSDCDRSFPR